ncbi:efflux RND transporter periplasmic adaptor subunit [candidate division KSB1 bacterium]|nr:efflux RND transporter periplasmic adaptor subunit [candidate division KSB1 bacterium]
MKKTCKSLIMIASLLGFACQQSDTTSNQTSKVPVRVEKVNLGQVTKSLDYNGDIKAEFSVNVFSKVPDRIQSLYVDVGDRIKKGDLIAEIFAETIEQAVRQARAALAAARAQTANAQIEYDRANRLYAENAMSKQQYDAIKTQYEAAKASLEQAQAAVKSAQSSLKDSKITAPISGIIGKRNYDVGDMANPAMPIVTIVQMDRVKIEFDATEKDLGKLALGQTAKISVKSYPKESFEGKVTKISPVLDPLTRMAEIDVLIDNPAKKLKPGMFARVEVITGIINDVIVVPRYATIENTSMRKEKGEDIIIKNYYVFVTENDSTVQQRKLDVVYVNHKNIAVNAGIQVGEKMVVEGQNNLHDRTPIQIIGEDDQS